MQNLKRSRTPGGQRGPADGSRKKGRAGVPVRLVRVPAEESFEQSMGRAVVSLMVDSEPVKVLNMQTGETSEYRPAASPALSGGAPFKTALKAK